MINKLLEFIRKHTCEHEYEELDRAIVYDYVNNYQLAPIGKRYTYICKKCGGVKIVKTY